VGPIDESLNGARSFDDAMADYQRDRDEHVPAMYEFTCQLATLEPPPPELQRVLGAVHGNRKAMDDFAPMNAGTQSKQRGAMPCSGCFEQTWLLISGITS
jgi:hypothetical protein